MTTAIFTKYIPATNTLGARIKAYTASAKPISRTSQVAYLQQFTNDYEEMHREAAYRFLEKLNWPNWSLYQGATKDGFVFVLA